MKQTLHFALTPPVGGSSAAIHFLRMSIKLKATNWNNGVLTSRITTLDVSTLKLGYFTLYMTLSSNGDVTT